MLNDKATTSTVMVNGECGVWPPSVKCIISTMCYMKCLCHIPGGTLAKPVYEELNKLLPWGLRHGTLTRYVKLQVAHAPGMPGTFPPAADFKENRLLAIPACITARASRTCRDACRDRLHAVTGKTFPAFPAHAHPQFYVSGKRPMGHLSKLTDHNLRYGYN